MNLPNREDINPYPGDLDGQCAVENFLGKNRQQITSELARHSMSYQEDLMFMGPIAFCYYFPSVLDYLLEPGADGDADFINGICAVMEFRLEHDRDEIKATLSDMLRFAEIVQSSYGRFEVDEEIYGDLQARFRHICESIRAN